MTKIRQKRNNKKQCASTSVALALIFTLFLSIVSYINKNEEQYQTEIKSNLWHKSILEETHHRCQILFHASPHEISKLEELDLKGCNLTAIPVSIQYAANLRKLDVSNNPLSSFPDELKHCKKLEIIFASSCASIESLPPVLGEMPSVTRLGWRSGSLKSIDPRGLPPNLVHLILTDNKIEVIENLEVFEKLKSVRKLMLSHNNLRTFGTNGGVDKLQSLELLRLGGNRLESIPDDLWMLPRLTWLTISGNPVVNAFQIRTRSKHELLSVKISDLEPLQTELGQGASGKVSLFQWRGQNVAVKLIHGVTSDGNAEDELSIYSAVGSDGLAHRVVGCLALLDGEKKGVIMEPLPSNLDDFALPPTIVEVTADRWDSGLVFSASFVKNALRDAVSALSFLHENGISHGDFYAHNIKVDRASGRLYLLDFGASFFKGIFKDQAEKLEVRAYGVLVGELLTLLDPTESSLKAKLISLRDQCMNLNVSQRPNLASIKTIMDSI